MKAYAHIHHLHYIHLPACIQSDLDYIQGCIPSLGIKAMTLLSNATVLNYRNALRSVLHIC